MRAIISEPVLNRVRLHSGQKTSLRELVGLNGAPGLHCKGSGTANLTPTHSSASAPHPHRIFAFVKLLCTGLGPLSRVVSTGTVCKHDDRKRCRNTAPSIGRGLPPPADRALFGFHHNATTLLTKDGGWCEHPFQAIQRLTGVATRAHLLMIARTLLQLVCFVAGIHHFRAPDGYPQGMSRQRTSEKRIATAVRFPESLHHELQDQADLRDVSVNFLVVRAVAKYLQNAPDPLALEKTARNID